LPDVLRAIRTTPSSTGISPYLLIFKHRPVVPLVEAMSWGEDLLPGGSDENNAWLLQEAAEKLYAWVKDRLTAKD
jgi:hypothetical protein